MRAEDLLPTAWEVGEALGPQVRLEPSDSKASATETGDLMRAASIDSAFRHFTGTVGDDSGFTPMAANAMSLVFDTDRKALRTFNHVAAAAHLRVDLDGNNVAVETVTAPNGLVSYWGYIQRDDVMVILTLDTLSPQTLSVGDLRSFAGIVSQRLREASTA